MESAETFATRLEAVFSHIHETRMQGLPIVNSALSVKAVGFQPWGDDWLGILVTPWFMNLMILPGEGDLPEAWSRPAIGDTVVQALPAGRFDFIMGEEAALGRFLICSLFSPVFEFGDQETAVMTAEAAMTEVMTQPEGAAPAPASPDRFMLQLAKGEVPLFEGKPEDEETQRALEAGQRHEDDSDPRPLTTS